MEQLNIEGKRSGEGFVCHKERLVSALSRAQAPKVEVSNFILGRKGLLNYLRLLGGSNIVKIIPSNGGAGESQTAAKRLKIVCGANVSYLEATTWLTEKMSAGETCQVRVQPHNSVIPNLGGAELAEALARVIPFAASKKDDRPVLHCVLFRQKDGKLTLATSDGFRVAELSLDFEDGEGEVLIASSELKGLIPALRKAKRARLGFEQKGERLDSKSLVIQTEAITYRLSSVNGTFPDYSKVIPTEFSVSARFDTREALRATASLSALFLDRQAPIVLSIAEGKLRLTAKDDKGEAEVEAEAEGETEVAVNGAYLVQALRALGGIVELNVSTPQTPLVFTANGYRQAVMPVVIPKSKPQTEAVAQAEQVASEAEAKAEAEQVEQAEKAETEPKSKSKRNRKREPVAV